MIILPAKPEGSIIDVQNDFNKVTLLWKNPSGGLTRYGSSLFLLAWIGGWTIGEYSAIKSISQKIDPFLLFWLVGWTLGGGFAVFQLYRLLRPVKPEKLVIDTTSLFFQRGTSPFNLSHKNSDEEGQKLQWLPQKAKYNLEKNKVGKILIDNSFGRQRLTIDYGAERIEVGEFLREPEREWVYQVLQNWQGRV